VSALGLTCRIGKLPLRMFGSLGRRNSIFSPVGTGPTIGEKKGGCSHATICKLQVEYFVGDGMNGGCFLGRFFIVVFCFL
jgi:hypothetical protein